jgi:uncharacterized RDD family membrane protein YckC
VNYIVKVEEEEYGPISESELIKWAEEGRINKATKVRNLMLNTWKSAGDLQFLSEIFAKQVKIEAISASAGKVSKGNSTNAQLSKQQATSFENKYLPEKAAINVRLKAGLIDLAIVLMVLFGEVLFLSRTMFGVGSRLDLIFSVCFIVGLFSVLLYFAGSLGVFAQTFGMWFFGLIIVRNGDDVREVYLQRAYAYSILLLIFWIVSPFTNYIFGCGRALHDILTDTQVVSISASRK